MRVLWQFMLASRQSSGMRHLPMYSMQGDVRASQLWAEIQELNDPAKHDDVGRLSIVASVAVLKSVGTSECDVAVFVSCQLDRGERDSVVKKLHLMDMALAASTRHGDLADTGAFEP